MSQQRTRTVEIFTAGCACCDEAIQMVREIACSSCDVQVLNMRDEKVIRRAKELGIRSVPAVSVNGILAGCCEGRGPDRQILLAAGVGQPL
jgi:glutaredoxin 3